MKFYDLLQLNTKNLKEKIEEAPKDEKKRFWTALIVKDILCVAFAIFFIVCMNMIFGEKNSSFAVVIFCILLGIRFVDFDYKLSTSIINLFVCLTLIILGPFFNNILNPLLSFIVNFVFLMIILIMTCEKPAYGNSSLYVFGYILLFGSPVTGHDMTLRVLEMVAGFALCAWVLYKKNKHKTYDKGFRDVLKNFSLKEKKCIWQIKLALGISLGIFVGDLLQIERIMWMGIAIMSVLTPYHDTPHERIKDRVIGVIIGSVTFLAVYTIIPSSYLSLIGPISGLCLGLCASYKWSSILNCFGALLLASSIYGGVDATFIRIENNVLGCLFALIFYYVFEKILQSDIYQKHIKEFEEMEEVKEGNA